MLVKNMAETLKTVIISFAKDLNQYGCGCLYQYNSEFVAIQFLFFDF